MATIVRITQNRFPEIAANLPNAADDITGKAAFDIEANAKTRAPFRDGNLRNSIQSQRTGTARWIVGTNVEYAAMQEFGGTIVPRRAPYLVFRGRDGGLVFAKSVTIPAQPYMTPAAEHVRPAFIAAMTQLERYL